MFRQIIPVEIRAAGEGLGEDEVEIVMSTGNLARDGHILEPAGADIDTYRSNPIVLWQHDPRTPVATAPEVVLDGNKIRARVRFASRGISEKADEIRGLVKDGIINAVSVGFDPIDGAPIDPKKPKGGQHFTRWALLECSFVSIPADTGAIVTAREHQESEMTEAVTTTVETDIKTGVVTATTAIEAEKKPVVVRAHRSGIGVMVRGLYDIGRLAWLLDSLCDAHWSAQVEAAFEGDNSQVPAMLAKAMQELGSALIAMTEEEVGEALEAAGANVDEDDGEGLDAGATVIIEAAHSAEHKRFLIGYQRALQVAKERAGKKHSSATIATMDEALGHHDAGMKAAREALRCFGRAANCVQGMRDDNGCDCSSDPDADNYDPDCECDRAVGNGKDQEGSKTVQTSDGVAESEGSENGRAARLRQLEAFSLRHEPKALAPV